MSEALMQYIPPSGGLSVKCSTLSQSITATAYATTTSKPLWHHISTIVSPIASNYGNIISCTILFTNYSCTYRDTSLGYGRLITHTNGSEVFWFSSNNTSRADFNTFVSAKTPTWFYSTNYMFEAYQASCTLYFTLYLYYI